MSKQIAADPSPTRGKDTENDRGGGLEPELRKVSAWLVGKDSDLDVYDIGKRMEEMALVLEERPSSRAAAGGGGDRKTVEEAFFQGPELTGPSPSILSC